jgi:hypothetical protein
MKDWKKIAEKHEEIIRNLRDYIHVGGMESDYYGYLDRDYKLESELATLKAEEDDQPRPTSKRKDTSHLCTICHENAVDSENGFDTCEACAKEF